ncbi:helix-turn-helix domain-containing protein [Desertihabitans aurantiacus]|uniref:helix-turn-helix domain-containing protein n=1 Tax=Desertihabitans aurantiacus TaxID=2282477 RepID=UPI000DF7589E|nr:helix-turn-helix domain-containing protein [Desertihabitans aurantiacus]
MTDADGGSAGAGARSDRVVDAPTYLTVAEVAEMMRLSRMSVYRLIHGGELEAVRFGRSFRVPAEAVSAYLKSSHYQAG